MGRFTPHYGLHVKLQPLDGCAWERKELTAGMGLGGVGGRIDGEDYCCLRRFWVKTLQNKCMFAIVYS